MSRSMALHPTRLAPLAAAILLAVAGQARAQSASSKSAAEALFEEGRRLMDQGSLSEACPRLAESQRLDPAVGTLLNLGLCYEKAGRTASAWVTFREAQAAALAAHRPEQADVAERRARALAPTLSHLTVSARAPAAGLEIKRDGLVVSGPALGMALPVDPGKHTVTATAPHKRTWTSVVVVGVGASAAIAVPELEDAPAAPGPQGPPAGGALPGARPALGGPQAGPQGAAGEQEVPEGNRGATRRAVGLVTAGVGVVGLGVGTAFVLVGKSRYDSSLEHCRETNLCDPQGVSLRNDARSAGTVASIALGAGAAAVAGGITLWLTAPKSHGAARSGGLQLSPTLGGAVLQGTF
jgi:tetratricopeptide (TPR) repeat protein